MKKAFYQLILFTAITAFVLSLSPTVMAEPNDTQTQQSQSIASDANPLHDTDTHQPAVSEQPVISISPTVKDKTAETDTKSIPINILSVLLGSLITLVPVFITNRSHDLRHKNQLEHDSKLKAIERKAAMRREVYLNAAEELVRAGAYLGSLAQIDLTKTNFADGLENFFAAFAKLGLVAEEETSKASSKLGIAYNDLLFKLMIKVIPINEQRTQINITNKHYNEIQVEIKRLLAEMRHQNESTVLDEKVFNTLDVSFKFQQKLAKEMTDEIDECWTKVNEYSRQFAMQIMDEMKVITDLQVPVMIGIRKELDIDTNIESYEKLTNHNREQIKKQLDNFLASLGNEA